MPPVGGTPGERSGPTTLSSVASSNQPGVVQALGDAFRIPTSAYSAPSSIGDSTWRTLDDEVHIGPVSRRRETDSPSGITARSIPFVGTPPMPSLHALANYVLEPENNIRDDVPEEMREDEGALSRRIRREESALRRGMEFGNGLFEDEDENGGSGSDTTEYAPAGGSAVRNGAYRRERRQGRREDGIVVVPDLGDREVESEVHATLAVHGIQSRLARRRSYDDEDAERRDYLDEYGDGYATETDRDTNAGSTHADYDYPLYGRRSRRRRGGGRFTIPPAEETMFEEAEDAAIDGEDNHMDVDDIREEDTDCISNGNSRSASPISGSTDSTMRTREPTTQEHPRLPPSCLISHTVTISISRGCVLILGEKDCMLQVLVRVSILMKGKLAQASMLVRGKVCLLVRSEAPPDLLEDTVVR
jgi:hypothetical protein